MTQLTSNLQTVNKPYGSAARLALLKGIDHTKLSFKPGEDPTVAIIQLCHEAIEHGFAAVCVRPTHVRNAKTILSQHKDIEIAAVIGFPEQKLSLASEKENPTVGDIPTDKKVMEAVQAIMLGATELDVVINIRQFKAEIAQGAPETKAELKALHAAAQGRSIKVIIETDLLSDTEIVKITKLCIETEMACVKTSTSMLEGGRGATTHDVTLIKKVLEKHQTNTIARLYIKASGGIRTLGQAHRFMMLGASRIGTSAGTSIVKEMDTWTFSPR